MTSEMTRITGMSRQTLANWSKKRPLLYQVVLVGVRTIQNQESSVIRQDTSDKLAADLNQIGMFEELKPENEQETTKDSEKNND